MGVVRTPDECFGGLVGYEHEPHYADVEARGIGPLRMHYVDAGPADGDVVLMLHGQPTWSYLYRKVIDEVTGSGLRAIAPDLIGYGRSDKLTDPTDYTFQRHVDWLGSLLTALDLREVTLVAQDWGGPIGMSALAADADRFSRVVATNTVLHTSEPALEGKVTWANHSTGDGRVVLEEALVDYVLFCQRAPRIVPSLFVDAVSGPLPDSVKAAYDAPFPDPLHTAGLRQMSSLVPLTRTDPGAAIGRATWQALERWDRPFLTAFSDGDPATRGWDGLFRERVPGAEGQSHTTIEGAGHFVQEQQGELLGRVIVDFVAASGGEHRVSRRRGAKPS